MKNVFAMVFVCLLSLANFAQEARESASRIRDQDQEIFMLMTSKISGEIAATILSPEEGRVEEILKGLEDLQTTSYFRTLTKKAASGYPDLLFARIVEATEVIKGVKGEKDPQKVARAMSSVLKSLNPVTHGLWDKNEIRIDRSLIIVVLICLVLVAMVLGIVKLLSQ